MATIVLEGIILKDKVEQVSALKPDDQRINHFLTEVS